MSKALLPGDVVSYSAGSTRTGPEGFRVLRARVDPLGFVLREWPSLAAALGGRPPLVINAYPATLGAMPGGILVDSYLSPRTCLRALRLAAREELTAIVVAQPLFALHIALAALAGSVTTSRPMIVALGGTPCPRSAEHALRTWLACVAPEIHVVHLYGAAEVDAACFAGRERREGVVLYRPRPDVTAEAAGDGTRLTVGCDAAPRSVVVEDTVRANGDGTWTIAAAPRRFGPRTLADLETWSVRDWSRRTGYLGPPRGALVAETREIALRRGHERECPGETNAADWCRLREGGWLEKPDWSDSTET